MSEAEIVQETDTPLTRKILAEKLREYGLGAGQIVLVHSSMSKLGWIPGGAEAVILALLDVLGEKGTLVMPAHSSDNSDPARWENPPVPEAWWPIIRETTPAFNPATTPTRMMGAIPDYHGLRIDPCLPRKWKKVHLRRPFRGAVYEITVRNPNGVSKGVKSITVDGKKLRGRLIRPHSDGRTHEVVVVMG